MSVKTAVVQQIQGLSLAGRTDSGHWVVMDGPEAFGGSDAGPRPKELVLLALGGCAGSDVISILRKKRAPVERVEVRLTGREADEHPRTFTSIHVEFFVHGAGVRPEDVERAIELSRTKYCSVAAMLTPAVTITYAYQMAGVPAAA